MVFSSQLPSLFHFEGPSAGLDSYGFTGRDARRVAIIFWDDVLQAVLWTCCWGRPNKYTMQFS